MSTFEKDGKSYKVQWSIYLKSLFYKTSILHDYLSELHCSVFILTLDYNSLLWHPLRILGDSFLFNVFFYYGTFNRVGVTYCFYTFLLFFLLFRTPNGLNVIYIAIVVTVIVNSVCYYYPTLFCSVYFLKLNGPILI